MGEMRISKKNYIGCTDGRGCMPHGHDMRVDGAMGLGRRVASLSIVTGYLESFSSHKEVPPTKKFGQVKFYL